MYTGDALDRQFKMNLSDRVDVRSSVIGQSWRIIRLQGRFEKKIENLRMVFSVTPGVPSTVSIDVDRIRTCMMDMVSEGGEARRGHCSCWLDGCPLPPWPSSSCKRAHCIRTCAHMFPPAVNADWERHRPSEAWREGALSLAPRAPPHILRVLSSRACGSNTQKCPLPK